MYSGFTNYISRWLVLCLLFFASAQVVDGQSAQLQTAVQQVWFNTLANKIGLDTAQFQLYQGTAAVGNTSRWMWNIFNAIPAKSIDHYYNPAQYNSFSSDYGLILFSLAGNDVNYMLSDAIVMYASADSQYAWDKTIGNLQSGLAAGSSVQLDTTVTITYVSDSTSGTKSTVAVNMQAQFNKYTVFYSSPYSKVDSLNQELMSYQPWFSTLMFSQAYNISDNTVWNNQSPFTWQKAFGPTGCMQDMCIALVAVDGVNIKVSFNIPDLQAGDKQLFSNTVENSKSYSPIIYTADSTNSTNVDTDGNFVYSITSPPGNAILLGVLVSSMAYFANHPH